MSQAEIDHKDMVKRLLKSGEDIVQAMTPSKANLIHAAMGISGEAGELLDAIKKATMYNKPLDIANVIEELGDLEFYMQALRQELELSRDIILLGNINKLDKRYSSGSYSDTQAQERADKEEEEEGTEYLVETFHIPVPATPSFNPITPPPKILILGYGRHGKDTFAEMMVDASGHSLSFSSSSEFCAKLFIFDYLSSTDCGNTLYYSNWENCFSDRHNHRELWHNLIKEYNTPDKARLAKAIVAKHDIYVGMRCKEELAACVAEGIFDHIFWVDASERLPAESKDSMTIEFDPTYMTWVDNNTDATSLMSLAYRLYTHVIEPGK